MVLCKKGDRVADACRRSSRRVIRGLFASRSNGDKAASWTGSRTVLGIEEEEMKMVGRPVLMIVTGKEVPLRCRVSSWLPVGRREQVSSGVSIRMPGAVPGTPEIVVEPCKSGYHIDPCALEWRVTGTFARMI